MQKYVFLWLSGRALGLQLKRLWVQFPGNTHTDKKCIAWMHCKSLWIKASAKCINVNKRIVVGCLYCFIKLLCCNITSWIGESSMNLLQNFSFYAQRENQSHGFETTWAWATLSECSFILKPFDPRLNKVILPVPAHLMYTFIWGMLTYSS